MTARGCLRWPATMSGWCRRTSSTPPGGWSRSRCRKRRHGCWPAATRPQTRSRRPTGAGCWWSVPSRQAWHALAWKRPSNTRRRATSSARPSGRSRRSNTVAPRCCLTSSWRTRCSNRPSTAELPSMPSWLSSWPPAPRCQLPSRRFKSTVASDSPGSTQRTGTCAAHGSTPHCWALRRSTAMPSPLRPA